MKVTFQTCCGVDIHKSFLVATIIKTTGGIEPSYQKRRFSTFNNSILEFKKWLLENECLYVCMESTGKYWIPVFNLLEDEINVTIMILTAIFQMLTTGETWNPCDLYKIDMPEALLEKQKQKAIKQAQKLLIRKGLLPPTEPIAS